MMKKQRLFLLCCFALVLSVGTAYSQTARQVLDKAAAALNSKQGVRADFQMASSQYSNTSGSIAVKGRKFHAVTPVATMWFDGKTQWTYLKKNNEVSVTNPTEAQQQAINPYALLNIYKEGYELALSDAAAVYVVHLTSTDAKKKIKEMFVTVGKNGYTLQEVKLLQGTRWTTFTISNLKREKLSDDMFVFNAKDYPSAELIDLR